MLSAMIINSAIFVFTTIFFLLKRSANTPAAAENNKNGITKIAPARDKIMLAFSFP